MFNNWRAKQYHHVVPAYRKHLAVTFMEHPHELVSLVETFLIKAARVFFVAVKAHRLHFLRHHDVHLPGLRLPVHLLVYHGEDAGVLAPHVMEIAQVIEPAEFADAQHRPSSFSTSRFSCP